MSDQKWNRSSAFTMEQIAILTTTLNSVIPGTITHFENAISGLPLTDDQRAEAIALIANDVTKALEKSLVELKIGPKPKKYERV